MNGARRASYLFLCSFPFLCFVGAALRPLRVPVVHQVIGGVLVVLALTAAWALGARVIRSGSARGREVALAGAIPWIMPRLLGVVLLRRAGEDRS